MNCVKMLLVEDEAIVAMQTEKDLKTIGYTVVGIYASGEKVLVCVVT